MKYLLLLLFLVSCVCVSHAQDSGSSFSESLGKILKGSDPQSRNRNQSFNKSLTNTLFGNKLARNLDQNDRNSIVQYLESLNLNNRRSWVNKDTGISYKMIVERVFNSGGHPCKSFTVTARIDGKWENAPGEGCRVAAGRWSVRGLSVPQHDYSKPAADEDDEYSY